MIRICTYDEVKWMFVIKGFTFRNMQDDGQVLQALLAIDILEDGLASISTLCFCGREVKGDNGSWLQIPIFKHMFSFGTFSLEEPSLHCLHRAVELQLDDTIGRHI